ncbi:hypothetical protein DIURU_001736 [Diutina rugosa]|uniref:IMP-specific 5'-nucleotidase 1 n=1 Tax=Diutina rugosa TaxID=5481 RepID=A0A642UZK7_DIURU|nr:uncharacterized protein DIURU_001736 [Diutina rugosa]KAA8904900.1 hypothetical protein DIURU_001736 [Diutina rugosa]
MTSRYRVEYSLKQHRRDYFIEFIKGLLAVPFVLNGDINQFANSGREFLDPEFYSDVKRFEDGISHECFRKFSDVFGDIERLVDNTILVDANNDRYGTHTQSRLRKLVPSIGRFHTRLPLVDAFRIEDERRGISRRRLVAPSFNDVRMILNTAQILGLVQNYHDDNPQQLKLLTFDGDVTLYEDGQNLEPDSPVVSRLVELLRRDFFIAVVTAAGYPGQQGATNYYKRLKGLVDTINGPDSALTEAQKRNLLIVGAESNYLFRFNPEMRGFQYIESADWFLPAMKSWDKKKLDEIMDISEQHLIHLQEKFGLKDNTTIIRKARSVGIIPNPGYSILREQLEEMVLSCSFILSNIDMGPSGKALPVGGYTQDDNIETHEIRVCAFNGGSDVWVDIGDKSLGVEALQRYLCQDESLQHLCPITKAESLHIGDQFASVGSNDFKARLSACTAWIASPRETVGCLDDLLSELDRRAELKKKKEAEASDQ